jgi:hypothetical protein
LNPDSARIAPTQTLEDLLSPALPADDSGRLADALETAIEISARARKVTRMLAAIPAGDTAAANVRCAHELAGWPQTARDVFAAHLGVRRPSELTWCVLVAAVAERRP